MSTKKSVSPRNAHHRSNIRRIHRRDIPLASSSFLPSFHEMWPPIHAPGSYLPSITRLRFRPVTLSRPTFVSFSLPLRYSSCILFFSPFLSLYTVYTLLPNNTIFFIRITSSASPFLLSSLRPLYRTVIRSRENGAGRRLADKHPFLSPSLYARQSFLYFFFFLFFFFLRHPCRRCRFPSSPDLEQIRGDSIRRISTSRPVPLRVNNCILLQKFLFFFSDRTKNIDAEEAVRFETLFFQVVFIFKRARGIWIVVSRSNPTTTTTTLLQILVAKWMQVQARAKNTIQSIQSSERYVKNWKREKNSRAKINTNGGVTVKEWWEFWNARDRSIDQSIRTRRGRRVFYPPFSWWKRGLSEDREKKGSQFAACLGRLVPSVYVPARLIN